MPIFPDFKSISLEDQNEIQGYFSAYQPETSELTFTNLYIWREHYRYRWSVLDDYLIVMASLDDDTYLFPPVGPASRRDLVRRLLRWMQDEKGIENPRIEKADDRLVAEVDGTEDMLIISVRDDFDYLYNREDLVNLAGRKYHSKRNHIHRVERDYQYEYKPITEAIIHDCLLLTKKWCDWRECKVKPDIKAECEAVHEAMINFEVLGIRGGAICVNGDVKAFSIGEMLNDDTMVVHVEKADPDVPQFYSVINQQFSEHALSDLAYVNREQDLGKEGLRKAKLSYYPDRLVEKFRIRFR